MKTSILAVGTELLFGQTVNTNAAYLSEKLNLMGFDVMYHFVVGDNPARLKEKLADAFTDTDLVILTGGLGPTQDDLTKEMVAEYMGVEMHLDERVVDDLNAIFAKRGGNMPENNMKQAYLPDGCTPFYNASGTAPGFALEKDGKVAICLPGPPREMKWLFENGVRDYLEKFMEKKMVYRVIRTIGIGESDLEMLLMPLIDGQTDPTIATYAKEGECTLRVASQRDSEEEASAAVDEMTERVRKLAGEYIYSLENEELNEVVVRILKEKGLTIASSESCTGGLFAAAITDVAGASDVISSSYVTYSNESKIKELGVPAETIERFGVVSKETAEAMAAGTKKRSGADIAVSITGFAGPESDPGHEAGEAYIGYAVGDIKGHIEIHTSRNFRTWNRRYFTLRMLRAVYMLIR
ncbi:MAG: competence/damage-inducible protein A [Mogibacterium sp.]|nr:competence/damage-inducible protein A [Mogibacterium sp.]MBQ3429769.1 competence/damage-inducible protein A [Mogibacterium sp.]